LPLVGRLLIHPDIAAVTCEVEGREIDLGGIGKGFALDQLRQILIEWGAEGGLLTAGASSMLAFGPQAWPVDLTGSAEVIPLFLSNQSLSASGTGVQGDHILHPGGKDAMPEKPFTRLWVTAPTATLAEIWSTALMLVEPDSILEFIAGETTLTGVYADRGGPLLPLFP
jgi:thiamine biosynthesis lipoprotein